MTTKRTIRDNQKKWLKSNQHLKILDLVALIIIIGKRLITLLIYGILKKFLKKKLNFTRIYPDQKLPFKDKEFDYVICAHVIEHVNDPIMFKSEIERIGKAGYIELPDKT